MRGVRRETFEGKRRGEEGRRGLSLKGLTGRHGQTGKLKMRGEKGEERGHLLFAELFIVAWNFSGLRLTIGET